MMLTPQQERFAQLVASGKSLSDAYRDAYPKSKKWAETSLHPKASGLAANGKVSARIAELRKTVVAEVRVSLESHLAELNRLKALAEAKDQVSGAIRAEELRGKASGLYVEQVESGPPGAFDGDRAALDRRIAERMVRLGKGKVIPKAATKH